MACMCHGAYALDTGDPRFEVWGYFQNDTAWHYTTNPGLNEIFKYNRVAPGLGDFGHPAAFLINRLSRQNIVKHRDSLQKFENSFNMKMLYKIKDCQNEKLSIFGRIYIRSIPCMI